MKEINEKEYARLRDSSSRLLGRVISHESQEIIYYSIDDNQKNFSATEILDTLSLTHPFLSGKYDVIRHWRLPEIKTINYQP